jgi:hypothetical protein
MDQRISGPRRPDSVNQQNTQLKFSSAWARVVFLKFSGGAGFDASSH